MGDFNRPGTRWLTWDHVVCSSSADQLFRNRMGDMGLTQMATFPTRGNNHLTLVFCSDTNEVGSIEALPPFNYSDNPPHLPVSLSILATKISRSPPETRKKYLAIDFDWAGDVLDNLATGPCSSAEESYITLYNATREIIGTAPSRRYFKRRPPAWRLARIKNKAWRILRSCPSIHNRQLYEAISKSYSEQVTIIHSERLTSICNSGDRRAFYKHNSKRGERANLPVMRRVDGSLCTNDAEKAQIFQDFFNQVYQQDVAIDGSALTISEVDPSPEDIFAVPIVLRLIKSMRDHIAMGPDGVPSIVIKRMANNFAPLLSRLFTDICCEGWIPPIWQQATIIPIYKGNGLTSDARNYRPIALTSILAKLYEKCIFKWLLPFLVSNGLVPSSQFGGMPGRSTTAQLIHCYDQWTRMSESGTPFDIYYIDIAKAFDRVPRSKLISCLSSMGVPHLVIRAIITLFDNRSHCVKIGTSYSIVSPTKSGVVQGTVLGCILFILYMAPLSTIINPIVIYAFIDDMKWSVEITQDSTAQQYLNQIISWLQDHGLDISVEKSHVMHCGRNNPGHTYFHNGMIIEAQESHRDLGVIFGDCLEFRDHIASVVLGANRALFAITSRYRGCNIASLVLAYTTYVRPILEYASSLWSPSQVTQIDLVERVQRSFSRRLLSTNYMPYRDRCAFLSLHSLEWRRIYLDLCLFYKILSERTYQPPLNDPILFNMTSITRGHERRVQIPFTRSNARKNSFFLRTARIWNALPNNIVTSPNLRAFKSSLDNYNLGLFCLRYGF